MLQITDINKTSSLTLPPLPPKLKKHDGGVEEEKSISEVDNMREECKMLSPDTVQLPHSLSHGSSGD